MDICFSVQQYFFQYGTVLTKEQENLIEQELAAIRAANQESLGKKDAKQAEKPTFAIPGLTKSQEELIAKEIEAIQGTLDFSRSTMLYLLRYKMSDQYISPLSLSNSSSQTFLNVLRRVQFISNFPFWHTPYNGKCRGPKV